MSDGSDAVKDAIEKMEQAPHVHEDMGPVAPPTMGPPPVLEFEVRARMRLAALIAERESYGKQSQERVNKLQNELNQTILECNNGIAGYSAAIAELQNLLGIQPQDYGNAQPGAANG
jgi:hypothetical protein